MLEIGRISRYFVVSRTNFTSMLRHSATYLCLLSFACTDLMAQSVRITPAPEISVMGGYMLSGGTDAYRGLTYGRFNVSDGGVFGGSIAIPARPGTNLELSYMYHSSGFTFKPQLGQEGPKESLGVSYIQIGGQQYIPNGNVHPYGSFTAGAAIFSPENGGSVWEFAFTAGVGVKNYVNEKIAVRLDARLVLPVFFGGFGLYCGTGGCGSSLGGTVGMWQGAFTGGLVYRLGQ